MVALAEAWIAASFRSSQLRNSLFVAKTETLVGQHSETTAPDSQV
jgi:hypothetical protein